MVFVEDNMQRLRKCGVAVEMVEAKPTLLYLRWQTGESFVDGGPVAEVL